MSSEKKPGFLRGIKKEFGKVTWPTKNETLRTTVVVIAAIIGVSVLVKLIDLAFQFILSFTV